MLLIILLIILVISPCTGSIMDESVLPLQRSYPTGILEPGKTVG